MAPAAKKKMKKRCSGKSLLFRASMPWKVTKPGIRRISRAKNDFPAPAKVEQSKGLQLARSAYCSADAKDSDEYSVLGQWGSVQASGKSKLNPFLQVTGKLANGNLIEGFGETVPGDAVKVSVAEVQLEDSDACSGVWAENHDESESDLESFLKANPIYI